MQKWREKRYVDGVACLFEFSKRSDTNELYIKVYQYDNHILLAEGSNEDEVYEDIRDFIHRQ